MNSRHFCWVNSMKDRKKPAIRFKGFTEDWEQRKLGEMVSFSKGYGYSKGDLKENGTPIILYGRLYTKYETIISEVDTFADYKKGSVYSKGGEVIVPASGETAEDISIASVVEKSNILLGGDLNVITPQDYLDSPFLAISISNGKPHNDMAKMAQGKSVVHLHNSDLEKIELPYPCIAEQRKISRFFSNLDKLITLHQRKYDKLVNIKKSMLEKMFPRDGKIVPDIRFSGFTEDWEQRKLGEVLRTLPFKPFLKIPDQDGKYEIIQQGNEPIIGYANGEPCEDFRNIVIFGDHTLSLYKPKQPFFVATDGVRILQGTNDMDGYYLLSLLEGNSPKSEGYKRYYSILVDREVLFTENYYEQVKIGLYFKQLDNLITLHQRKLEKLKNIKKSCLEKMFI